MKEGRQSFVFSWSQCRWINMPFNKMQPSYRIYLCPDPQVAQPSSLSLELSGTAPSFLSLLTPLLPSKDKLPSGDVGWVSDGELTTPESSPSSRPSEAANPWSGKLLPLLPLPSDTVSSSGFAVSSFWTVDSEVCTEWIQAGRRQEQSSASVEVSNTAQC